MYKSKTDKFLQYLNYTFGAEVNISLDYLYSPSHIKVTVTECFSPASYLPFYLFFNGDLYKIHNNIFL